MRLPSTTGNEAGPIGVIVAIDEEQAGFREVFAAANHHRIAGRTFREGRIDGHAAVVVRAGIGKVNAALAATLLCQSFGCRALALSGVAGAIAPDLGLGDVVVADRLICYDYGAQVDGSFVPYQPGTPPLPSIERRPGYGLEATMLERVRATLEDTTLVAPTDAPNALRPRLGPILTADTLVNCSALRQRLHDEFGGLVVEMEGAAIAQIAKRFGVPALIVRSVSDMAGGVTDQDFSANLGVASRNAALVLRQILRCL